MTPYGHNQSLFQEAGDWVEMFGDAVSVDEVAGWADTIAYEILTGMGERVERVYSGG